MGTAKAVKITEKSNIEFQNEDEPKSNNFILP
jgi:hypothetical protein